MQLIDFYNNPNAGLFFYTTDKFTIIPSITPDSVKKIIKDELKTAIVETNVYHTNVNNIFLAGNEEYLFAPDIINPEEKKILENIKGLKLVVLKTKLNALGNNMVFNKNKVLINPNFEDSVIQQLEGLKLKVFKGRVAGVETVGANVVVIGRKALINPDTKPEEERVLTKELGLSCEKGTVNNKSNIVKAGFIVNINGVVVSNSMTGPEMMQIEELWKNGYGK